MDTTELLDKLAELYAARDLLNIKKQELIDAILTPEIKAQIADIEAEFSVQAQGVNDNISEAEAQVKDAVIVNGATVKGQFLTAVYSKGRTSWDSKRLEGLMIALPQLAECRTIGAPSVSIRKA